MSRAQVPERNNQKRIENQPSKYIEEEKKKGKIASREKKDGASVAAVYDLAVPRHKTISHSHTGQVTSFPSSCSSGHHHQSIRMDLFYIFF
jgi:hypothetical protein